MTKRFYLLIAIAACLILLAGCQSSQLLSYTDAIIGEQDQSLDQNNVEGESPSESDSPTDQIPEDAAIKDYSAAYNAYPLKETMLTVDGISITWDELFYWYIYDVSNMEANFGEITDWDAASGLDSSLTNRQYVMQSALDTIAQYSSLQNKAKEMGVELNEVDKVMMDANWQQNVINYGNGDEQAFIDYMSTVYLSKSVYNKVNEISALYQRLYEEMYGANGEKLDQKQITEKGVDMGYMRAKHILIATTDYTNTQLPEAQVVKKRNRAKAILTELTAIKDPTEREARMNELILAEGEDPGTAYYTDGYTFLPGRMTEAFENAVKELDDYELSPVVETEYGYHIIMRLPLSADTIVEQLSETEFWTLRQLIAQELFTTLTESWANEAVVELTETYNVMDLSAVFGKSATTGSQDNKKSQSDNS